LTLVINKLAKETFAKVDLSYAVILLVNEHYRSALSHRVAKKRFTDVATKTFKHETLTCVVCPWSVWKRSLKHSPNSSVCAADKSHDA